MKEEGTMQYLLKPMLLALIAMLGVALTIVPAHAQSGSRALANIPFEFSVRNTTLKAGSYTVEQLQSGILALSTSDEKNINSRRLFWATLPIRAKSPALFSFDTDAKLF
jgi:hypothetical protein